MLSVFRKRHTTAVGMQIASGGLSLLALEQKDTASPTIKEYLTYPAENFAAVNDLIPTIKAELQQKSMARAKCCFVLDDQDYQLLTLDAPNVPQNEMKEAVKWKVKDLIPHGIEDVVFDIFMIPESQHSSKKMINVIVVHREIIDGISQLADRLELDLVAIDIPELCYRNYLETTEWNEKSVAVVLIKENRSKLMVIQNGAVLFSRSFSITYKGGLLDDLPESEITLELQRSLDYFERQLKQVAPSVVYILGENITADKVTEMTRDSLQQTVVVGSLEHDNLTEEDNLSAGRLIATYGGALRKEVLS